MNNVAMNYNLVYVKINIRVFYFKILTILLFLYKKAYSQEYQ